MPCRANSVFGAATGSGSSARAANFQGVQFGPGTCLSAQDLRDADFTGASFNSASSVHGNWFAGANLFDVTFDGTKFQYDATLANCGSPPSCTTVTVPNLCTNCPCTAHVGCLDLAGATACPQNQGAVTLAEQPVCQRPTVQATAEGVTIQNTDLTGVSFGGADLTNSVFASNMMDHTTDFAGTILAGVNFTKENLGRSVDLSGAVLSDTTNFAGAVLSDFPNSNQGVNLSCVVSGQTETGGCHFPAASEYAERLAAEALKVGRRLAREGAIGRAAVDFVAVKRGALWRPYAVEINLRCGGTTHPLFALTALTDGAYEPLAAEYRTRYGDSKCYAATDHLDSPAYRSLTPDDLLDIVAAKELAWDAETETGVVLHMVSALAVAGRIGLTAIGNDLEQARDVYYRVKDAVDEAAEAAEAESPVRA